LAHESKADGASTEVNLKLAALTGARLSRGSKQWHWPSACLHSSVCCTVWLAIN